MEALGRCNLWEWNCNLFIINVSWMILMQKYDSEK